MGHRLCAECIYWDQEALHVDIAEELGEIPTQLDNWGYCRLNPPGSGLPENPWETRVLQREKDWCSFGEGGISSTEQFLREHPDLTPSDVGELSGKA